MWHSIRSTSPVPRPCEGAREPRARGCHDREGAGSPLDVGLVGEVRLERLEAGGGGELGESHSGWRNARRCEVRGGEEGGERRGRGAQSSLALSNVFSPYIQRRGLALMADLACYRIPLPS